MNCVVVVNGEAFSGKGYLIELLLAAMKGIHVVPTGKVCRDLAGQEGEIGEKILHYSKRGLYLPDEDYLPIFEPLLEEGFRGGHQIILLDGSVRTERQGDFFLKKLFDHRQRYRACQLIVTAPRPIRLARMKRSLAGKDPNRSGRPDDCGGRKVFNNRGREYANKTIPTQVLLSTRLPTLNLSGVDQGTHSVLAVEHFIGGVVSQ
jgi:adenylate kinase family enzyme